MKNEKNAEFKFLEIPNGEDILAMLGSAYIKNMDGTIQVSK